MIHLFSGLKTSVEVQRGKEGQQRGSKVFNTIIQMEAGHLRENPQTPQQQENSSNHLTLQKADGLSFSSKQSSHQTKRNNKKLTSTGFKQQQKNKIIYETARSDGPNSGSGKLSKLASLKRVSPVFICI